MEINKIFIGDNIESLKQMDDNSVNCCITSPPYYGLRDYGTGKWVGGDPNCPHRRMSKYSDKTITGHAQEELKGNVGDAIYKTVCPLCGAIREDKQIGLEETPEEYIEKLVMVFREVRRVLRDDATLWLNIGDSYASQRGGMYQPAETLAGGINGKTIDGEKVNRGRAEGYNPTRDASAIGLKHKDLIGIPWLLAFALRKDGWYLRQDIIWHKPNPMPESVKDRCTKSHEYIFLLSKSPRYYYDYRAIQEPCNYEDTHSFHRYNLEVGNDERNVKFRTKNCQYDGQKPNSMHINRENGGKDIQYSVRNKRDVWSVLPSAFKGAHFATFPEELIEPMILAGCPIGGTVLDPFMGSGTVGVVAKKNDRNWVGCELNPEYAEMAENRIKNTIQSLF